MRFIFLLAIFVSTVAPNFSAAEVMQLNLFSPSVYQDRRNPSFVKVNETPVSNGIVYVHRDDLLPMLRTQVIVLHNCEALLLPFADQAPWLLRKMTAVEPNSPYALLPRGVVAVTLQNPNEMTAILANGVSGGFGGGGNRSSDTAKGSAEAGPTNQPPASAGRSRACQLEEVCLAKDGTATADLTCGDFKLSVSSSGVLKYSVSSRDGAITISGSSEGENSIKLQQSP